MSTSREWLEADGLGGIASGTEDGTRSRRYHAWLLGAASPRVVPESSVPHGMAGVASTWRLLPPADPATLHERPFLSGRDHRALRTKGSIMPRPANATSRQVSWRWAESEREVTARHNGTYRRESHESEAFAYDVERARGFDHPDLLAPGVFEFGPTAGDACLPGSADNPTAPSTSTS